MSLNPGMLPVDIQRGLDRLAEIYDRDALIELLMSWTAMAAENRRTPGRTVGTIGDLDVVDAPANWWVAMRATVDAIRAHPQEWAALVDVMAETEERRLQLREWGEHLVRTAQDAG